MDRDQATVVDILNAARKAEQFSEGFDFGDFSADEKTQAAVLHEIMLIGEAVKRLSAEFRDTNSGVDWQTIAGMRDVLIHEYDTVDVEEVWQTVEKDIPELIKKIGNLED